MAGLPVAEPPSPWLGLPEEILGVEILVRLPPRDLVRCRAVCRAWRRVASTHDILMAHHRHQPSLALVLLTKYEDGATGADLRAFDHRAAAEARFQPVARVSYSTDIFVLASCDGLLLLSVGTFWPSPRRDTICTNPTTRQMGGVPEIQGFRVAGLYRHPPTGEYRLLLLQARSTAKDPCCYVFALGCNERRPRPIGCPRASTQGFFCAPVVVRGNLHWSGRRFPAKDQSGEKITVFDTTAEAFRLLCSPVVQTSRAFRLFEVDGALGMYNFDDSIPVAVDIWVMQDYGGEVWSHRYHVELPVASMEAHESLNVMVVHDEEGCVCPLQPWAHAGSC